MLSWLTSNVAALGVLGAAITFAWSAIQFIWLRRKEQQAHEFQAFHRLIKELVSPDETEKMWIDRQVAVVFELRHFPRYYEVITRILMGLRNKCSAEQGAKRLIDEIDLTIEHIKKCKPNLFQQLWNLTLQRLFGSKGM